MNKTKRQIKTFNKSAKELFGEVDDYCQFAVVKPAMQDELKELEERIGLPIPKELVNFYKKFGGLRNIRQSEAYCFAIDEPSTLIKIKQGIRSARLDSFGLLPSFGLVDMMTYSWANDRPEFQEYKYLSKEQTSEKNSRYKCFGWYRDEDILDGAYYLYFDDCQSFGALYYNQNNISAACKELKKLLSNKIEGVLLDEILSEAIEKVRLTMIDWNE